VVLVRVATTLSTSEPELAKACRCIDAAVLVTVWLAIEHARPTGKSGPTFATLEPAGTFRKPA
jgi:hypothetical protein